MSRPFQWFSGLTLVVAVALVVVLARQVRGLRADLAESQRRYLFPRVGDLVPPFDAVTLDGATVRVGEGPSGSRQLLIVFNTTCPICLETAAEWRHLDSLVTGTPGLTVLGWSQHSDSVTALYVVEHGFRFPVIVPDLRWLRPYKLEGVPSTLVVSHDGRVLFSRSGRLTPEAVDSAAVVARGG